MNAPPFFSILVPTYNHAKYVGAALDSLVAQTDADWEAVVVNDGSTDNTAEVLNRYALRDPRIRIVHQPNGGTGAALNRALSEARGEWVCWLSSDDFFDPRKLATHRSWIRRDPRCRFHFTYFRLLIEAKNTVVDHQLWGPLPEPEFQVLGLFYRNYVSGISICVHRESWQKVGRFNERLRYAQDYDMWLRLLAHYPGTFIPEWTCTNRNHAGQGSEVFPQACYYDCGAAGVQFLNEHRFDQMFPLLDLCDPTCAVRAVERALIQASDETAFLYWYGAHPCLLMRTLEWAWDRTQGEQIYQQREPCRRLARQISADAARRLRGTPLGWHWRIAAAATALPDPDLTYTSIRPMDVGLAFLHDLRAQGKVDLADLGRYFKMQYGADLPPAPKTSTRRTAVICDPRPTSAPPKNAVELAHALQAAGCQTAVVTEGPTRLRHLGTLPILEAPSRQLFDQTVGALLPADIVVWSKAPADLSAFPSKQHYVVSPTPIALDIEVERILQMRAVPLDARVHKVGASSGPRRKVVFIGARPWGGGAERVTFDLLHALDPEKHELHFVHLFNEGITQVSFAPHITVHNVELQLQALNTKLNSFPKRALGRFSRVLRTLSDFVRRHLPPGAIKQHLNPYLDSIRQLWPHVIALKEIFQRIGSDAVLVPVMEEAAVRVWLAQAFKRQPYCVSLHIAESKYMPVLYPNPDRLVIENFLLSNACRGAAAVTIPSQGCKQDLVEHYNVPNNVVQVMPNPIDFDAIRRLCDEAPNLTLPPLDGKHLFIHAARLCYQKNHDLLLDACNLLRARVPNFVVVCLGEGDLRRDIQNRIDELGLRQHVLLLGEVKNPFAYMARADGLVLTSRFESFALVLVEAMACGAVPISVDCPHGPREVLEGGRHGLLVPMDDPNALADAMQRAAEDRELRASLRENGYERARKYDLSGVASQWQDLIYNLTSSPAPINLPSSDFDQGTFASPTTPRRRKVVFIGRSTCGGGAERATHDLMHGLNAAELEIHFVHLFNKGRRINFDPHITVHSVEDESRSRQLQPYSLWRRCLSRFSRYVRNAGDRLSKHLPHSPMKQGLDAYLESTMGIWSQVVALNDIFNRIGSDALLIPVMEEAAVRVWLTQMFARRPYCAFLQIAESEYMPLLFPSPDRLMVENHLLASACRAANAIAIPSLGCKNDLIRNYNVPAAAIEVAPNPANVSSILMSARARPEVPPPELNGKYLFVHVARLDYQKNHQLMLNACVLLKKRGLNFLVVCLGEGELRSHIQQAIGELGLEQNVLLIGEVANPFPYMKNAHGLLLTSRFESFALVLVEAMACGAVPISVDCPHGPREVLDDGKYGLLVPMNDAAALAEAMYCIATDSTLRQTYVRLGLQRARRYDLPEIASQWKRIIGRLSNCAQDSEQSIRSAA